MQFPQPSVWVQKMPMVKAGAAAFIIIALFMILYYRLPGFVASIALMGQLAGTIAAITGFFAVFPSFTLTVPGTRRYYPGSWTRC